MSVQYLDITGAKRREMNGAEVVNLKVYVDEKFKELDKRLDQHFKLTDKAVEIAAKALEARLEALNDFRSQIQEERLTYARKDEVALQFKILTESSSYGAGRTAGKEWSIGLFVAIALGIISLILNLI